MLKNNVVRISLISIAVVAVVVIVGLATISVLRSVYPDNANSQNTDTGGQLSKEEAKSTYDDASKQLQNGNLDEATELYKDAQQFYKANPEEVVGREAEIDAQLSLIDAQKKSKNNMEARQRQESINTVPSVGAQ